MGRRRGIKPARKRRVQATPPRKKRIKSCVPAQVDIWSALKAACCVQRNKTIYKRSGSVNALKPQVLAGFISRPFVQTPLSGKHEDDEEEEDEDGSCSDAQSPSWRQQDNKKIKRHIKVLSSGA